METVKWKSTIKKPEWFDKEMMEYELAVNSDGTYPILTSAAILHHRQEGDEQMGAESGTVHQFFFRKLYPSSVSRYIDSRIFVPDSVDNKMSFAISMLYGLIHDVMYLALQELNPSDTSPDALDVIHQEIINDFAEEDLIG